ncbi:MAG: UDP-2,3-diacylglucosamine diphosphatase [Pseudomonadota bacterium]
MSAEQKDLLLADLHLPVVASGAAPEASFLNEAFLRFCAGPARAARSVFLLGDVFESWVGDDLGLADYPREIAALKALSDSGVELRYQTGNRDFLLGRRFELATGAVRLPDEHLEALGGTATLLAHGDQYCTDDVGYQRWRAFSHNRLAQWLFLKLPAARRRRIAGGLRDGSAEAKRRKAESIMDVNDAAIVSAFRRHRVKRLIHGHTHRPAEHQHAMHGGLGQRIVLADWRAERIEWLCVDARGWRREGFANTQ